MPLPTDAAGQNAASQVATVSPENPATAPPDQQWMQLDLSEEDINTTVKIVTTYRNQWATDRLLRLRVWTKNVLMYRGIQVLDWHEGSQSWIDSLAWYRGSDKAREGETTELERYCHPITLMLGTAFVGLMSQEVPLTVVKPQDARVLADLTTAAAAQDAIGIIERRNKIRQMTRGEFEFLYLYGTYFKWTRALLDGEWSGYDTQPVLEQMVVAQPDRYACPGCGRETPAADLAADEGSLPQCPGCGAGLGPESFYEAGPGYQALTVVGLHKIPRAMVRQTIHSPMEIDADPKAKEIAATAILAFDQEIDIGEARMMFPTAWDKIREGAVAATSANADYERLRRDEVYSMGTAYTSDTNQQRPTYSQVWLQPMAYNRFGDKEYVARMMKAAPQGLKLSMLGSEVVGVKRAVLTKEWTCCRRLENFGLYCPSIAEGVVSFNERFNSAMQLIDDYYMRAACGVNFVAGDRIDTDKWKGNAFAPSTVIPLPMMRKGNRDSLADAFMHFEIPVNPGLPLYPQMLLTFAQLLNGLPPQVIGQGTQPGVETLGGQQQMLGQANLIVAPYWENVKEEHALAAQNAIECLQMLLKCGAAQEIWEVIEDKGAQFRNNYVNLESMQGRVRVYPDEDQDLPQTPEQVRQSFLTIFEELSKGNAAAQAIFDVPANQEIIGSTLFPNIVSPVTAQRAKTLQDMNTLLEQPGTPVMNQDGSVGAKLPVEPSILEDFSIALPTISEFAIENADLRVKNPVGWSQIEQYWGMCQDMQAQQEVRKAQLGLKARMAATPPPTRPDPGTQAAVARLHMLASQMADQLARLSMVDPAFTKGTITGQVSAGKEIIDSAIDASEALAGKK
jgi:hypothetical protein